MKGLRVLLGLWLSITSCNSLNIWGYKSLGDNYYIWAEDNNEYALIYCDKNHNPTTGGFAVTNFHSTIIKYNFNQRYIILEIRENSKPDRPHIVFWVLDKTKNNDFERENWQPRPKVLLDSIKLSNYLKQNKINTNISELRTP